MAPVVPPIHEPFLVDYAPTDRATCKTCQATLAKNCVRFGRKVRSPWHDGFDIQYRHFTCGMSYVTHPRQITGIMDLKWKDFVKCVKKLINVVLDDEHPTLRTYRLRNDALWELKTQLQELPISTLTDVLQLNQIWFKDRIKAPEAAALVADALLFGKLPKCPICDTVALRQSGTDIRCVGYLEGSNSRCTFTYSLVDIYNPDNPPDNLGFESVSAEDLQRQEPICLTPYLTNVPALRRWKRPSYLPPLFFPQEKKTAKRGLETSVAKSDDEADEAVPKNKELAGFVFTSIGATQPNKRELQLLIQRHGGTFSDTLTPAVSFLLVGDDLKPVKATKRFKDALQWDIPVLHCSFVTALTSRVPVYPAEPQTSQQKRSRLDPAAKAASSLPSGLILRQRKYAKYYLRAGKLPHHPFPTVQTVLLSNAEQGEAAAVPKATKRPALASNAAILKVDSWFAGKPGHRVYVDENNNAFNATTLFTDITTGINKFYNQQLLELPALDEAADHSLFSGTPLSPCYCIFLRWGRVGSDNRLTNDFLTDNFRQDKERAIEAFQKRCVDLTGIQWDERFTSSAKPGRYRYVFLDDQGSTISANIKTSTKVPPCRLPSQVKALMELIFDQKMMEAALQAQNLDIRKMPLGTISRQQMTEGYQVLQALQTLLIPAEHSNSAARDMEESRDQSAQEQLASIPYMSARWKAKVTALTGQFYSAIPHSFPLKATPPLLDSLPKLRQKILLLEQLMEISIANSIMTNAAKQEATENIPRHPLDSYYTGLGCALSPLTQDTQEFQNILAAVRNTHGVTHSGFQLDVTDIFAFHRDADLKEYQELLSSHEKPQRRLLWHGSRLTNWAGILKLGLRAAPKDAPISGYMFGRGIYFADMVSKAAQYCYATSSSPNGLLVVAEVVLGPGLPRYKADARAASVCRKEGRLHAWGVGQTAPDPTKDVHFPSPADASNVPLATGRGVAAKHPELQNDASSPSKTPALLYNEYIVYDKRQILIRYIIKVALQFKTIEQELSSPATSSDSSSSLSSNNSSDSD